MRRLAIQLIKFLPVIGICAIGAIGILVAFGGASTWAQDSANELITVKLEGTTKSDLAITASKEIQANLTSEFAKSQITNIIGEKRYAKNKMTIENKIIRQSAKFIPFVNPGPVTQQPDGTWKMAVEFRLSQSSLRKMILDAGLLNDSEGPASILPLVEFTDKEKSTMTHWWMGEEKDENHKFLVQIAQGFHEKLQTEFSRQGFHMIKPQGTEMSPLPEAYRIEHPAAAELTFIADYYQAAMVVKGDVSFHASKTLPGVALCSVKLQVVQPATGRVIAEVSRHFETGVGTYEATIRAKMNTESVEIGKELSAQVLEAWQRGTLNTNLIRMAVRGRLTPKQLTEFKTDFARSVHEVKGLKERLFEPGQVLFEVDYAGDVSQLGERLRSLSLSGFQTHVAESTDKTLALDVKAN